MPVLVEGQIFERYRIIKWLGNGRAGESYEAEDKALLRKVTLKLIHPWTTLPDSARRQFFREMQGISALIHPYLAPVLDYGETDGRIYVARRYLSSGSLLSANGRFWFRTPLTKIDAFKYVHQLATTLHFMHQRGYVHGSLTFSNILVLHAPNREDEEKNTPFLLADVGLASFVQRFGKPGNEALTAGLAPEQANRRVVPASDQFALAVVLYFWLSGRPPYLGTSEEVEQLKRSGSFTPLSKLHPEITQTQDRIIQRALAVQPEARYSSVLSFAEALLASLRSQPLPTLSPPETHETDAIESRPPTHTDQPTITEDQTRPGADAEESPQPETPDAVVAQSRAVEATEEEVLEPGTVVAQSDPAEATDPATSLPTEDAPVDSPLAASADSLDESETSEEEDLSPSPQELSGAPDILEPVATLQPDEPEDDTTDKLLRKMANASRVSTDTGDEESTPADPDASPQPTQTPVGPLLVVSPPNAGAPFEFPLTLPETHAGRAGASDLLLDQDELTSRHHALFKLTDEQVLLFDQRSQKGVFVNGQQIAAETGYELAHGDQISIGDYELTFHATR